MAQRTGITRRSSLWIGLVLGLGALVLVRPQTSAPLLVIGEKQWEIIGTADTASTRALGLSHRDQLPPQSGLLFTFPEPDRYGFWMKDMRFPIDIIFIRDGRVDSVVSQRQPGDLTPVYPREPVTEVFEVNAGEGEGIEPGQSVRYDRTPSY